MSWIVIAVVSLLSGLLGSLGMGAGAVLLLYLRVFGGVEQFEAQGINLIFFLPIAVLSILLHARNHLISWKAAFPPSFSACGSAASREGRCSPSSLPDCCSSSACANSSRRIPAPSQSILRFAAPKRRSLSVVDRRRY